MKSELESHEVTTPYIFVSCSRKDLKKVHSIIEKIQVEKIQVEKINSEEVNFFYPDVNLANDTIEKLIENSIGVIAFHSGNSKNSSHCNNEIFIARSYDKKIISVYLENVDLAPGTKMSLSLSEPIKIYKYAENDYDKVFSKSLDSVKKLLTDGVTKAVGVAGAVAGAVSVVAAAGAVVLSVVAVAGLVKHIFSDEETVTPSYKGKTPYEVINPYEGSDPFIFISYSHADSEKVYSILKRLQSERVRFWYDGGIESGADWNNNIAEHVKKCKCMIAFHSKKSSDSSHCKDEIAYLNNNRKSKRTDKKILSIYLEEDVDLDLGIEMKITRFQSINLYDYDGREEDFYFQILNSSIIKSCMS